MKEPLTHSPSPTRPLPPVALASTDQHSLRALIDGTLEAVTVHCDGLLIYLNRAAVKLFGAASADELLGQPVLARVHPNFVPIAQARMIDIAAQQLTAPLMEQQWLPLDGSVIDVEVQSTRIAYGGMAAVQVAIRDVRLQKQQQRQLERLAHFDPLTQLPNRALLTDRLHQAIAQAKQAGKNRYCVFDAELDSHMREHHEKVQ